MVEQQRDALTVFRDVHVRGINARAEALSGQAGDLFHQGQTEQGRGILGEAMAETGKVVLIEATLTKLREEWKKAGIVPESIGVLTRYLTPQNNPEITSNPPRFHPGSEQPMPEVSPNPDQENLIREITSRPGWETRPYPDRIADLVGACRDGIDRHLVLGLIYDPNSDNVEARFNISLSKAKNRVGPDRTIVSERRTGRLMIAPVGNGRIDTPDVKKN